METNTTQQELTMQTKPQTEHQWLQKLIGEWTYETEASMGPDQPPERATGTESVRSLGGLWILAEGQGQMPGCDDTATTIITLGYDPQRQRYVGTFIGSMMTYLWIYDGELDPAQRMLTLDSEGPSMTEEGKMAKYKDIIQFISEDHRMLSSQVQGNDGNWHSFMTAHYRRKQ